MPHVVVFDGERRVLRDTIARGALRVHRTADGDAVVVVAGTATRDGLPVPGNLTVVEWGAAALVRAGGIRVEILWQAAEERCGAPVGWRCRRCFGQIDTGEAAVVCTCAAPFHDECAAVRTSCPACGARPTEEAA